VQPRSEHLLVAAKRRAPLGRRRWPMLAALVAFAACSTSELPERPSVLVVTLDTTRADHLSTLGGPRGITPHLDALGERSAVFTRAHSETNVTNPSHLSVMTGMRAIEHGVMNNATRMPADVRTLPQLLRARGYDTAAFVSVHHLLVLGWTGFRTLPPVPQRIRAREVTDRALAWLAQRGDAPFFLWVHYFDPHTPNAPETRIAEGFYARDPDATARRADRDFLGEGHWLTDVEWRGDALDPGWGRALYAGEVFQTDREIGRLLRGLAKVDPNAIIVVVADHGESLDEHGIYFTHAGLYDVSLHIPLIIHVPGLAPLRSDAPALTLDVAPTLAELTHVALERPAGRSLVPLLRGRADALADRKILVHQAAHNDAVAVRKGPWKLIWKIRKDNPYVSAENELYDVDHDPGERIDRIAEHPEIADALRPLVEPWVALGRVRSRGAERLDDDAIRQLEALGYAEP
jgi:arylsulfatase A-like enzyme